MSTTALFAWFGSTVAAGEIKIGITREKFNPVEVNARLIRSEHRTTSPANQLSPQMLLQRVGVKVECIVNLAGTKAPSVTGYVELLVAMICQPYSDQPRPKETLPGGNLIVHLIASDQPKVN